MDDLAFRSCRAQDLEHAQRLVDELYATDAGADRVKPNIALTFAEFQRCPEKGRIVAFDWNGHLIGYAIIVFFWSNEFCGDVIEVDELFVDGHHRRLGIGRRFFEWLESAYPGCAGLSLQVSAQNKDAARLYESLGFKQTANRHLIKVRRSQANDVGTSRETMS